MVVEASKGRLLACMKALSTSSVGEKPSLDS